MASTSPGEQPADLGEAAPPDWSPVPETSPGGSTTLGMVRRAGGAVVAIGLLWWLGHHSAAALLLVVAAVVATASAASSGFSHRIESVERAFQRVVGRVLSAVLLTVVQLLVFTPLWLLLRIVRYNPLTLPGGSDSTFWIPTARYRKPLYQRPFAYERAPARMAPSRGLRVRAALGVVLIVVLLDLGIGAVIDALREDAKPQTLTPLTGSAPAASRGEPWGWRAVLPELKQAIQRARYDPFLGFTVSDFHAQGVNISGSVRRSFEPRTPAGRPVTVYFFGGSAMFGLVQRDGHTIASDFARLAAADGVPVRVVNYAQPGYVNWQELLKLQSLVSDRSKPDLAVFYDGFNELLLQFALGSHTEPTHLQAKDIALRLAIAGRTKQPSFFTQLNNTWASKSALHRLGRSLGIFAPRDESGVPLQSPWTGAQSDHPGRRAAEAVAIYERGVDLVRRLAHSYRFRVAFFWQPSVYTKRLARGEESLPSAGGYDAKAWRTASRAARSRLRPPVVDLSTALNQVRGPVMYDVVHTNERGARVMARALYERLRRTLHRIAQSR